MKYEKKAGGRKSLLQFTPEVKCKLDAALLDKIHNNEVRTVSLNVYKYIQILSDKTLSRTTCCAMRP
jgi:hypothetical protein